ncbi:fibrinogen C domain-containing protein 1-like [Syngnathus typhle]|uniref:fibrinogen C domain-containing protein 1-like n=1 Tax=Syngnathus typhle TaxID=161592 RepID=UPI002A6AEC52|nr:fibrinogen C domain-containing protein 1-like [Syngnathus typhle]
MAHFDDRSGTTDDGVSEGASESVVVGRSETSLALQFQRPSDRRQDTTPWWRLIRWGSILAVVPTLLLVVLVIQNIVFFHLNRPQDIVKELGALVGTLPNSIPDHNCTDLACHWAALQTALAELKASHTAISSDLEKSQTALTELKAGQEAGQTALAELKAGQTALAELKAGQEAGQTALAELKASHTAISSDLEKSQTALAELKAGQEAGQTGLAELKAGQTALAELKAGQEAGQTALAELKASHRAISSDLEKSQTALAELKAGQTALAELKASHTAISSDLEKSQTALAELTAGHNASQSLLAKAWDEISSDKGLLSQRLKDLKTDYQSMSQELSQEQKELHDFGLALSSLQQKVVDQLTLNRELKAIMARDCSQVMAAGKSQDGIHTFFIGSDSFKAYCDMSLDGGGWTVIQRRKDGSVDFFRGWNDYRKGFGDLAGEHWLGLQNIHALTASGAYQLRIDFTIFDGRTYYALYDDFSVGRNSLDPDKDGYPLLVSGYSGTAGESLTFLHSGMKFTTKDRDQDTSTDNCANKYKGAWWYRNCYASNLNGLYKATGTCDLSNALWLDLRPPSYTCLRFVEMKIRPRK